MDRLIAEKETEVKKQVEEKKISYAESFENKTLGDLKKEREQKELEEFKIEQEELLHQQFETKQEVSQNIIEKPNYDFIEENPKVLKLKKKEKTQPKSKNKIAGIVLASTLAISTLICVTNSVIIDNLNASYSNISEVYDVNLQNYLRNIQNLDATKKSLGFLETYPEEILDAGDVGQKSNWFDRFCNFISGMFGG